MFNIKASVLLFLILLGGCSSDGSDGPASCSSGDAPYIGCWITAGCQSMDNPVNNMPVWGTIRYEFTLSGDINEQIKVYTNSSCAGSTVFQEEKFLGLVFSDQGTEQLPSAITANRLAVQSVDVGAPSESEVLVHVASDNRLCLSNNLILNVDGYRFTYNEVATAIDFSNCLESTG